MSAILPSCFPEAAFARPRCTSACSPCSALLRVYDALHLTQLAQATANALRRSVVEQSEPRCATLRCQLVFPEGAQAMAAAPILGQGGSGSPDHVISVAANAKHMQRARSGSFRTGIYLIVLFTSLLLRKRQAITEPGAPCDQSSPYGDEST